MHPLIEPNDDFEPSPDSKRRWLSTKKSSMSFTDLELPGLFQTSNWKAHKNLIYVVFAIELYGLYVLYNVLPQPLLALLFTGLDFIFARFAHLLKSKACYAKNLLKLAEYGGYSFTTNFTADGEIRIQKNRILGYSIYEWIFRCGIIIVALIKIVETFHYGSYLPIGQLIFIGVLYIVAAVIHIFITGFFLSEFWFKYGFIWGGVKKERRLSMENTIPTAEKVQFYRLIDLGGKYTPCVFHKQEIIDSSNKESSIIKIWGILQDDELNELATHQGAKSKELAIKLLRIQIKNIEQPALGNYQEEPFTFKEFIDLK